MSRKTEAYLKALPKIPGAAAGFVIENGLCAGYPYTLSHYVNSKNDNNAIVPDADNEYFEIRLLGRFALRAADTPSLILMRPSSDVANEEYHPRHLQLVLVNDRPVNPHQRWQACQRRSRWLHLSFSGIPAVQG